MHAMPQEVTATIRVRRQWWWRFVKHIIHAVTAFPLHFCLLCLQICTAACSDNFTFAATKANGKPSFAATKLLQQILVFAVQTHIGLHRRFVDVNTFFSPTLFFYLGLKSALKTHLSSSEHKCLTCVCMHLHLQAHVHIGLTLCVSAS